MLSFTIIPSHLLDEANMLPSLQASAANLRSTNDYVVHDLIGDDQLRQIAGQAANKNWPRLALTLGFLEYDIEAYRARNNRDPAATVGPSKSKDRTGRYLYAFRCSNCFVYGVNKKVRRRPRTDCDSVSVKVNWKNSFHC